MVEGKWYPNPLGRTQELWGHRSTLKGMIYEIESVLASAKSILAYIQAEHEIAYKYEREQYLAKLADKEQANAH